jgi:hypothetical protein
MYPARLVIPDITTDLNLWMPLNTAVVVTEFSIKGYSVQVDNGGNSQQLLNVSL